MADLLPSDHSKFRTKGYWENFFIARDNETFEWYGEFADVKGLLAANLA